MFVRLALIIFSVLIVIGILLLDENVRLTADEFPNEEHEVIETTVEQENETYWKYVLKSFDLKLGLSTAIGTIVVAFISYRWIGSAKKVYKRVWHKKQFKKEINVVLHPVEEDVVKICSEQFSTETNLNTNRTAECSPIKVKGTVEVDITSNDVIENSNDDLSSQDTKDFNKGDKVLAVHDNLIRDIENRMKIFEQQLEEFRIKMRNSDVENSEVSSLYIKESTRKLDCYRKDSALECSASLEKVCRSNDKVAAFTDMQNTDVKATATIPVLNKRYARNSTMLFSPVQQKISKMDVGTSSRTNIHQMSAKLAKTLSSRKSKSNIGLNSSCKCLESESMDSMNKVISGGDTCNFPRRSSDCDSNHSFESNKVHTPSARSTDVTTELCYKSSITNDNDMSEKTESVSSSLASRKAGESRITSHSPVSDKQKQPVGNRKQVKALLKKTNEKLSQRNRSKLPTK